jgi:hypothetical protein
LGRPMKSSGVRTGPVPGAIVYFSGSSQLTSCLTVEAGLCFHFNMLS